MIGFLDVGGGWDPSLAFVMAGAIGVFLPVYRWTRAEPRPRLAERFYRPEATAIDARLVVGAALFGLGWGAAGLCPGPALVNLGTGTVGIVAFVAAMVAGIGLTRLWLRPPR